MKFDFELFKADLERERKARGWYWADVAKEAGLHHATIYNWINGHRKVSLDTVVSLAHLFELDLNRYMKGSVLTP